MHNDTCQEEKNSNFAQMKFTTSAYVGSEEKEIEAAMERLWEKYQL